LLHSPHDCFLLVHAGALMVQACGLRFSAAVRRAELVIWAQRMKLLGLIASGFLVDLAYRGKCDPITAFTVIGGVFFYWIHGRGTQRDLTERITAVKGGCMPELPGWLDRGQKKLEDLFGDKPAGGK
jgi:hypothetical protein